MRYFIILGLFFGLGVPSATAGEAPILAELVTNGSLPPESERLPEVPLVVTLDESTKRSLGKRGGTISTLMGSQRDLRMMTVYGYARLVKYDRSLNLVPDILLEYENEENKVFTLRLRPGHKWSDGSPFTAEDFRYQWEDYLNHPEMERVTLNPELYAAGEPPRFEVIDPLTVRYSWDAPNPLFLPALAGARPLNLYAASTYLKQFHPDYADHKALADEVASEGVRDWQGLQIRRARSYRQENPNLPTLQPWRNTTEPPASQFVFERNPYYHKVDQDGVQLPYLDEIIINIAEGGIIAAKTGSGESDLQLRYLRFEDYTFLKEGEEANKYSVRLWTSGKGSAMAFYPNLNTTDTVWRELFRDARLRRALSLGIDRQQINQVMFVGLAKESANTVLPGSPLYRDELGAAYAEYDPERANAMLDEMGLKWSDTGDVRLLPNGKPMELIVESAGENSLEADVMQLVSDNWAKLGVKMFTRSSQRDIFRARIASGSTLMSVWPGVNIGAPTVANSPKEFVPSDPYQLQWPAWGNYMATRHDSGEPIDDPAAARLVELNEKWIVAAEDTERRAIWDEILDIHADQVFAIGIVTATLEPVVVSNRLMNVPEKGISAFEPYAYFGVYEMDTFWVTDAEGMTRASAQ